MNIEQQNKKSEASNDQQKTDTNDNDEALVVLQFTDLDDAQYCQHFSNKFKTINIEQSNPIIQIGSRFYTGEYTNNIGTYLFFEESSSTKTAATSTAHHSNENISINKNNNNINKIKSSKETNLDSSDKADNSAFYGKSFKKIL